MVVHLSIVTICVIVYASLSISAYIPLSLLSSEKPIYQCCHPPLTPVSSGSKAMFLLIFQSLCVHKVSFLQHFTRTHLNLELLVWNMCENHLCVLQVFLCALL